MMKLILLTFSFTVTLVNAATNEGVSYNCDLKAGSHPRHGVDKVNLTYGQGIHFGRVLLTLIKSSEGRPAVLSTPGVYSHEANIHKGRFAGFKKYFPSERFQVPNLFKSRFPSFALLEGHDHKTAILAFPESENAVYNCLRM